LRYTMGERNHLRGLGQWGEVRRGFTVRGYHISCVAAFTPNHAAALIGSMSVASSLSALELLTRLETAQRCK
jgi:hypothetical protein